MIFVQSYRPLWSFREVNISLRGECEECDTLADDSLTCSINGLCRNIHFTRNLMFRDIPHILMRLPPMSILWCTVYPLIFCAYSINEILCNMPLISFLLIKSYLMLCAYFKTSASINLQLHSSL